MRIAAAIASRQGSPLTVEDVELIGPAAGEVLVRVVATGICHTDITALRNLPIPFPAILGHEGAGVVESIGPGVKQLAPGDHVLVTTNSCGDCRPCRTNNPAFCLFFRALNMAGGQREDGSCTHRLHGRQVFAGFLGQSSFATALIAHERSLVKVDRDLPLDVLCPLGCGIQTGAGAVFNTLKAQPDTSIAIFGAGAVGLAALMAAKVAGCADLTVIDTQPARLQLAQELGATCIIDATAEDPVAAIRALGGVDYSIEATGVPQVATQAVEALAVLGTAALLGVPAEATISFDLNTIRSRGLTIKGSRMAGEGVVAQTFIPFLIGLWRKGLLPIEKMIRFYDFAEINRAIHDAESGESIKPVLRFGDGRTFQREQSNLASRNQS